MHQLERLGLATILVVLAGCDVGPSNNANVVTDANDTKMLHDAVVANASTIMQDALIDLSEALPHMTTAAEPEAA